MKISVDIDGVVCSTIPNMIKAIEKRGYTVTFDKYNPYIEGVEDIEALMYEVVGEIYSTQMDQIKPYDDAVSAIPLIAKYIGPITFVTARKEQWHDATLKWLQSHFKIPFDLVHKRSFHKSQFILDEGFDAFIEDRLRTANQAAELGINTYLINRSWNIGRPVHTGVTRVRSLFDFYTIEMIERKSKSYTNEE